ncbi:CPBP family intramembrane metalloprotease [Weissella confusa]|nr:CPBP family intramembrane metalloprotease [Weissella confusa]
MFYAFAIGLLFAVIYLKTGSLLIGSMLHFMFDFMSMLGSSSSAAGVISVPLLLLIYLQMVVVGRIYMFPWFKKFIAPSLLENKSQALR